MRSLKNAQSKRDVKELNDNSPSKTDEALLHLIQTKDRMAYEELFSRYIKRAYALGMNLTRNKELAEEAAQEALLAIWRSASSFAPERGTAKAWIFRIIANKAVQIVRKEQHDRTREKDRTIVFPESLATHGDQLPDLEQREMKAYLRGLIAGLSQENRNLVALYYGAGFSQDKIAEIVSAPQRKVSDQLKKILEQLKANLTKGGYIAPAALGTIIFENLWTGWNIPQASAKRTLERIFSRSSPDPTGTITRGIRPIKMLLSIGLLSVVALGLAVQQLYFSSSKTTIFSKTQSITSINESSTPLKQPAKLWKKTWDFNTPGATTGLGFGKKNPVHKLAGGWNNSGCISFQSNERRHNLVFEERRLPLKITYQTKIAFTPNKQLFSFSLTWSKSQCSNVSAMFTNISSIENSHYTKWTTYIIYIQQHAVDTWIFPSSDSKPRRQTILLLNLHKKVTFALDSAGDMGFEFDNLSVEEVEASALPDLSAFISAFESRKAELELDKPYPAPELSRFQNLPTPILMTKLNGEETDEHYFKIRK